MVNATQQFTLTVCYHQIKNAILDNIN